MCKKPVWSSLENEILVKSYERALKDATTNTDRNPVDVWETTMNRYYEELCKHAGPSGIVHRSTSGAKRHYKVVMKDVAKFNGYFHSVKSPGTVEKDWEDNAMKIFEKIELERDIHISNEDKEKLTSGKKKRYKFQYLNIWKMKKQELVKIVPFSAVNDVGSAGFSALDVTSKARPNRPNVAKRAKIQDFDDSQIIHALMEIVNSRQTLNVDILPFLRACEMRTYLQSLDAELDKGLISRIRHALRKQVQTRLQLWETPPLNTTTPEQPIRQRFQRGASVSDSPRSLSSATPVTSDAFSDNEN